MVKLVPMTDLDFQGWLVGAVKEYAGEKVKSGNWPAADAQKRSEAEFKKYLPEGPATKNAYMYSILDEALDVKVGMIWFTVFDDMAKPYAFILDLRIYDEFQRKGYGSQAMQAVEEKVKELGLDTVSLHVFGHNHAARALYEKLGYEITNINMTKKLG
jgi:RimJ/RimL family protein N-acetyltransferase